MKSAVLTPLTQRERALQLLDRFTFGPRPGEVDRVMATGADKWLEQQLNPDAIPNGRAGQAAGGLSDAEHVGGAGAEDVSGSRAWW